MSVCSKSSLNIFIPGVSSTGHSNQKCKKEAISCSKECNLEKLPPNEGWFFIASDGFIFHFLLRSTSVLCYEYARPVQQPGISSAVCQADCNIHSPPPCLWMRCRARRIAGTGRNRTPLAPSSTPYPAICTADISHTNARAWASGVHLLAWAGFEVVLMSCCHAVCVQEPVWATWHV